MADNIAIQSPSNYQQMARAEIRGCRNTSVHINSELRYLPCVPQYPEYHYDMPPPSYSEARANSPYPELEDQYKFDMPPPTYIAAITNSPVSEMSEHSTAVDHTRAPTTANTVRARQHRRNVRKVPDYMRFSILAVCCCFALGIPAVVFSSQANSLKYTNPKKARKKAEIAKIFIVVSLMVGISIGFLCGALRPMFNN